MIADITSSIQSKKKQQDISSDHSIHKQEQQDNKIQSDAGSHKTSEQDLQEYNKFFNCDKISQFSLQSSHAKQFLSKNSSFQLNPCFVKNIKIQVYETDRQSSLIELSWGFFKTSISTLRIDIQFEQLITEMIISKGAYGNIYTVRLNKKNYVVKCIELQKSREVANRNFAEYIYCEFFINKFSSELQISPKIYNIFGYDLIFFKDSAIFVQQQCLTINQLTSQFVNDGIKNIENQLRESLRTLHFYRICHCDIKPQNIVWSKNSEKAMLIDYGLSFFVPQEIGEKSFTNFFGTFQFCSPEMKKLYFLKNENYVDMYYNDVVGMTLTFKKLKHKFQTPNIGKLEFESDYSEEQQNEQISGYSQLKNNNSFYILMNLFKIKYSIFIEQYQKALILMKEQIFLKQVVYKIFVEQFLQKKKPGIDKVQIQKYHELFKKFNMQKNRRERILVDYYSRLYDQRVYFSSGFSIDNFIHSRNLERYMKMIDNLEFLQGILEFFYAKTKKLIKKYNQTQTQIVIQNFYTVLQMHKSKQNLKIIDRSEFTNTTIHIKLRSCLIYLLKEFKQLKLNELLLKLWQIFKQIEDYITAVEIEEFIANSEQYSSGCQFYIIRMSFWIDRFYWNSQYFLYADHKWRSEIQSKVIENKDINQFSILQFQKRLLQISMKVIYQNCLQLESNFKLALKQLDQLTEVKDLQKILRKSQYKLLMKLKSDLSKLVTLIEEAEIRSSFDQSIQQYDMINFLENVRYIKMKCLFKKSIQNFCGVQKLLVESNQNNIKIEHLEYLKQINKENVMHFVGIFQYMLMSIETTHLPILTLCLNFYLDTIQSIDLSLHIYCFLFIYFRFGDFYLTKLKLKTLIKPSQIQLTQFRQVLLRFNKHFSKSLNIENLYVLDGYKILFLVHQAGFKGGGFYAAKIMIQKLQQYGKIKPNSIEEHIQLGKNYETLRIIETVRFIMDTLGQASLKLQKVFQVGAKQSIKNNIKNCLFRFPFMLHKLTQINLKTQLPRKVILDLLSYIQNQRELEIRKNVANYISQLLFYQSLHIAGNRISFEDIKYIHRQICSKFSIKDTKDPKIAVFIGIIEAIYIGKWTQKIDVKQLVNQCMQNLNYPQINQLQYKSNQCKQQTMQRRNLILICFGMQNLASFQIISIFQIQISKMLPDFQSYENPDRQLTIRTRRYSRYYTYFNEQNKYLPKLYAAVQSKMNKKIKKMCQKNQMKANILGIIKQRILYKIEAIQSNIQLQLPK